MKKKTHREMIKGWVPFTEIECARFTAKGYWHNLTVCDLLDRNAENVPEKLAFSDGVNEVTWKELQQKTNRMAAHLLKLGIEYGDFVILDLMNTVEFSFLFLGLNRIGAIPIMCLPRHRRAEVSYEAKHHEAKGLVMPVEQRFDYTGMVDDFRDEIPHARVFLTVGGKAPEGWIAVEELMKQEVRKGYLLNYLEQFKPVPDDICVEHLSGGTTGIPKGIPRTHNDQICQWNYQGQALGFTDDSVPLVALPVLHNAAMVELYGPAMFRGATTILCLSPKPENMFELIEKYRVTHVLLIPIQMTYWQKARDEMKKYDLSSLKTVMGAAEKVRPELVKWFIDDVGVQFVNIFGMAEGPLITTRWDDSKDIQMHTIGKPIIIGPDVQVRLIDDEYHDVKAGEIGEMIQKGPLTFKGYFRADEENKNAFDADGFMHSGDLMSLRQDGRYIVEGRKKDMIKRAGENVYPNVIEDKIVQMEKVAFAAVVGMPDKVLGEKLCAFAQPVPGETITFDEVIAYLKRIGVAVYELPERFELLEGWPLTPINKINKRLLRAYITAKAVQEGAISKEHGDEYLRKDKLTIDKIIQKKIEVDFTGTPS